jgi:lipopolysaccharide/colanic/teichoic acid biosynthesis glycosyltransferase
LIAEREKQDLFDELYGRYAKGRGSSRLSRFYAKKYGWLLVVAGARTAKRLIDIVGAATLLVVLSPVFAVVSLIIKLQDGGPVFFSQTRVGQYGREFVVPKFRSMVLNADDLISQLADQDEHPEEPTFKIRRDPRVTPIGRVIRKLSIDELPQLWCVLKGEVSLVGPRPHIPREVAQYSLADRRRLDVLPGLTCIWQVSGRADLTFPDQIRLDVQYIESQSLWLDVTLLLKTIPAVLIGKGAY